MSNPGARIYTKVKRADKDLVEKFEGIPVANIGDNMGRIAAVDSGIKAMNNKKLVGTAITVKAPHGDNLMFHKAIDMAQEGDVIVVNAEGCMGHALCGEMMFAHAIQKGVKGFIIDGCIRDLYELQSMDISVYARGTQPNGPYKNGPGEINSTISLGGQIVRPGDIVCCDMDGIVIVKREDAENVLEKAIQQNKNERIKLEKINNGTLNKDWIDEQLKSIGCEIIDDYCN